MSEERGAPSHWNGEKPPPGFREQVLVTLVIVLATGSVFGGIWLLDAIAH